MNRQLTNLFACAIGLAGCGRPSIEPLTPDGLAPAAAGILDGTVTYVGPRPSCTQAGDHVPAPRGRAILTLFEYENPPPPAGGATTPVSLLTVPGRDLFGAEDCRADDSGVETLTRSAPFTWPDIPLDTKTGSGAQPRGIAYQVRGFYDDTGDFVPFFAIRNQPTAGDVLGAALERRAAGGTVPTRIDFGAAVDHPRGERVRGLTVTLSAVATTEPPLCRWAAGARPLSSGAIFPTAPDPAAMAAALWASTRTALELVSPGDETYRTALAAAGLPLLGSEPLVRSWYVRPVDNDGDGSADPHPVLGDAGWSWQFPVVLLQRARTASETAAGVPAVLLVGALDPTQVGAKRALAPTLRILVPPVALVELVAGDPSCRVPYVPPGNTAARYAGVVECQELPTGRYGASVLSGVAGGTVTAVDGSVSETGYDLVGGSYSGQVWYLPNELGPADTRYNPRAVDQIDRGLLLDDQGPARRLAVVEETPADGVRSGCGEVGPQPVPARCCAAVSHLCGLPLCASATDADGHVVREITAADNDGSPACVPFEMPRSCCGPS